MDQKRLWLAAAMVMALVLVPGMALSTDDASSAQRRQRSREFHARSQERTGVLVPMYIYPANIHKTLTSTA